MRIESSGMGWYPEKEGDVYRRMKELNLVAHTEDDAKWLAKIHGCLFRGRLDPVELRRLADEVDTHLAFQSQDNCGGS